MPKPNSTHHILRSQDFSPDLISDIFALADSYLPALKDRSKIAQLQHKGAGGQIFTLFYEPSTRTRVSFEAAAHNLGLGVVGTENAREFSSSAKGETIEDTIRVLCQYHPSAIVLRHHEEGAAERAAAVSDVPIINAGDGKGQHPTQAILDLYTIHKELGRVDNLNVVLGGDLANGRTARSLVYLLGQHKNIHFSFVAPKGLEMGADIKEYLEKHAISYEELNQLDSVLAAADVVYWTRVQKERLAEDVDYAVVSRQFELGSDHLAKMKKDSIIMHPLPRVNEIKTEVDQDSRAAYFRQAGYGLPVRMALFAWAIGLE